MARGACRRAFGAWQPGFRRRVLGVWPLEKTQIVYDASIRFFLNPGFHQRLFSDLDSLALVRSEIVFCVRAPISR